MVALDISKSMQCDDVYPSRLEFAKNKFNHLLSNLTNEKIGILGFSNQPFLIAPITSDYSSIKFLISHLDLEYTYTKGSNIMEALIGTNNLLKKFKSKALIIFTDGTDNRSFTNEIEYAKKNDIKVFIYGIGTVKGGIIKDKETILKDSNGNIVITKLNSNIKQLALQTGGIYLTYSIKSSDIKQFTNLIKEQFKNEVLRDLKIQNNTELFYIPLGFALIFFILSISGFRKDR